LFKPRLRPTAGHMLRGSPVGAFVVDLVLGAVVAFIVPMVLTSLWEVRALALTLAGRPAWVKVSRPAWGSVHGSHWAYMGRHQVSLQTQFH